MAKELVAVGKKEVVEEQEQPTPEEIGEVCTQLRRLSPEININTHVRSAICSFWHNVPAAMARVKSAMVALRTAFGIASGWCKQPTGLFVQTLKNGVSVEGADTVIAAKEYPHPTLEQLNQRLGNGGAGLHQAKQARIPRSSGTQYW